MTRLHLATANTPGAIALLQLHGQGTPHTLEQLTGRADWRPGRVALCSFADIDEGLAVLLQTDGDAASTPRAQLMPHGGPRVVQRLIDHLLTLGCSFEPTPDPRDIYPEAGSPIEADMLYAIANAASPAAIDRLAAQPERWRQMFLLTVSERDAHRATIAARSAVLDQLIAPPTVVVVGRANVGKSTLTNALTGRAVSIVADLPGTTRDWVGSRVELSSDEGMSGVAVHWLDTPGLRDSGDTVEQRAIVLARSVIERADVLVAMRDAEHDWPDAAALPRTPDLWVMNKCDDADQHDATNAGAPGRSPDRPLRISADLGHGLPALQHHILTTLGLASLDKDIDNAIDAPWAFTKTLRVWAAGEPIALDAYLQP